MIRLIIWAGALTLVSSSTYAQRLYNKAGDETAQKALEAAKTLSGGSIFSKEIANIDTLAKLETESLFSAAAVGLRRKINELATGTWTSVKDACVVQATPKSDEIDRLKGEALRLQGQIDEAKKRIDAKNETASSRAADTAVRLLANGADAKAAADALIEFLTPKNKKAGETAAKASEVAGKVLDQLTPLATTIQGNQQAVDEVKQQLADLESSLDDLQIRRFQVEADFNREQAAVLEREQNDLASVDFLSKDCLSLLDQFVGKGSGIEASTGVVKTLRTYAGRENGLILEPDKLDSAIQALYNAAAIAARSKMPAELKKIRHAQAMQRYSVRKAQVEARAYEVAVSSGVQRLALYYKGGIRPESIAQIIYTAATVAIPPVVAVTQ